MRDCADIELNLNDFDYKQIIEKYGINMHYDSLRKSQQTPFGAVAATQYFLSKNGLDKTSIQKVKDVLGEQYLLKKQLQDENRNIRKIKNDFVRAISVAEEVISEFKKDGLNIVIPEQCHYPIKTSLKSNAMICLISDWHIGYQIINCRGNYYNWDIANERINKLISCCQRYVKLYNVERIYVYNLGDLIEHTYMRKTQSQSCEFTQGEQIQKATKLLYRFITALSEMCDVVYDGVAGNHDRFSGEKTANYDGDNVNSTITPLLKEMFEIADNKRVHVIERDYSDKFISNEINGIKCKFSHGHEHTKDDRFKLKNEISMDNEIYDLYCEGHWHNFRCLSENRGRYIVTNGCLSGYNDYSTVFGCATNASQSIIILGDKEIEMVKCIDLQ